MFAPGHLPRGPKIETKKALLLVDLQNDFVDSKGRCYIANTDQFLSKLPSLVQAFRVKGPVVWIKTAYRTSVPVISTQTGGPTVVLLGSNNAFLSSRAPDRLPRRGSRASQREPPIETLAKNDREAFLTINNDAALTSICCLPDGTGVELPTTLQECIDRKRDLIFWKSQYSALGDFQLVLQLRSRMVNELYICGSLSNIGVFATVCDAVQQGFKVTVIEDCLGYCDESCHVEAMRQMADDFGVEGVDYQELMDDIHGLLGDVIPISTFTRRIELTMAPTESQSTSFSRSESVRSWVKSMAEAGQPEELASRAEVAQEVYAKPITEEEVKTEWIDISSDESAVSEQAARVNIPSHIQKARHSPKASPPRKRSTSDREECEEFDRLTNRTTMEESHPQSSISRTPTLKKSRIADSDDRTQRSTATKHGQEFYTSPTQFLNQSKSTGRIETRNNLAKTVSNDRAQSHPNISIPTQCIKSEKVRTRGRKASKVAQNYVSSGPLGDGDSRLDLDLLDASEADAAFHRLKKDVVWQKMYHRTGEVPRLVAVQGEILPCGAIPIYRHPADESPPLLSFDATVDSLRKKCEKAVGHPLNHVLIQHYRTSEDNISEHSDKTLDITMGSSIVNLSLGAMRTMTLRAKKESERPDQNDHGQREAQRIRLPHNSLFVLGWRTNANWLHSIRADKRPVKEKTEDELAYEQERISLTFRSIATFIDTKNNTIWGQGATQKTREEARQILTGKLADSVNESMIIGFGKENHLKESQFDWAEVYGRGFDVVNYEVRKGPQ